RSTHKDDCGSKYCIWSNKHAQNCPHCPQCSRVRLHRHSVCHSCSSPRPFCQFLGPDSKEVIRAKVPEYCDTCDYWWKKNNTYRRKDQQPQQ
ncbi:hypothetical protein AN958_03833, partial [Leucoagaricus sp. SymC.cos]